MLLLGPKHVILSEICVYRIPIPYLHSTNVLTQRWGSLEENNFIVFFSSGIWGFGVFCLFRARVENILKAVEISFPGPLDFYSQDPWISIPRIQDPWVPYPWNPETFWSPYP